MSCRVHWPGGHQVEDTADSAWGQQAWLGPRELTDGSARELTSERCKAEHECMSLCVNVYLSVRVKE